VAFSKDGSRITASRFVVQATALHEPDQDRRLMEAIRGLAHDSKLNVTVFHPKFIFFDQLSRTRSITIKTVSVAAGVMLVVSMVLIPYPICSAWIGLSILSIGLGVVGYMTLWGVNLDPISLINLIMCVGFSVDFSAHIVYSYVAAKVDTPEERIRECLYAVGLPILQGGCSTILGLFPLLIAPPSYIYHTFFKLAFLVIFLGMTHGVFLLPVLLSLLGPGSFPRKDTVVSRGQNSL